MSFYLTPTTIAFIVVALLFIFAGMLGMKSLRHYLFLRKRFILMEVPAAFFSPEGGSLSDRQAGVFDGQNSKFDGFIKNIPVPFVFEIAVHHLGKRVHYYLAVPKALTKIIKAKFNFEEASDYNIYHSQGSHLGFYLKSSGLPEVDLNTIDFSRINEVGEGAVIQLIVVAKKSRKLVNFRVLISAPTPYQAQEIALGLNSSLTGFKPTVVTKNMPEFIHQVTFREFDEEEVIIWDNV